MNVPILGHFHYLFSTNTVKGLSEFLSTLGNRVTAEKNEYLTCDFTLEEMPTVLKQMHMIKALGLDGMSPIFYQKY